MKPSNSRRFEVTEKNFKNSYFFGAFSYFSTQNFVLDRQKLSKYIIYCCMRFSRVTFLSMQSG